MNAFIKLVLCMTEHYRSWSFAHSRNLRNANEEKDK